MEGVLIVAACPVDPRIAGSGPGGCTSGQGARDAEEKVVKHVLPVT